MLSRQQVRRLRSASGDEADRLRLAMDEAQLTQEQLEALSGVPQSTISKVLNRKRTRVSVQNAGKLACAFGVAVEDIFPSARPEAIAS